MTATLRAFACALLLAVPATAAGSPEPVAIVYQASGLALRTAPGHEPDLLRLLDRLPAEVTVELPPRSRLILAFVNGRRYEISGPIQVKLGPEDLAEKPAGARELPPVPRLPHLAPIVASENLGPAAGAQRARGEGEKITGLYPRRGAATLPGETFLFFKRVKGAREYRVEVRDSRGGTVFQKDAETSPVKVPAEMLHGGSHYVWTVRALSRPGPAVQPAVQGEGDFVTLSDEAVQAREKAREILIPEGKDSLLLLVEIDRDLGLRLEARDELEAVIDEEPRDVALRAALVTLERQWKEEDEQE